MLTTRLQLAASNGAKASPYFIQYFGDADIGKIYGSVPDGSGGHFTHFYSGTSNSIGVLKTDATGAVQAAIRGLTYNGYANDPSYNASIGKYILCSNDKLLITNSDLTVLFSSSVLNTAYYGGSVPSYSRWLGSNPVVLNNQYQNPYSTSDVVPTLTKHNSSTYGTQSRRFIFSNGSYAQVRGIRNLAVDGTNPITTSLYNLSYLLLAKWNSSSSLSRIWAKQISKTNYTYGDKNPVVVDTSGNIYTLTSKTSTNNLRLDKFNNAGVSQWCRSATTIPANSNGYYNRCIEAVGSYIIASFARSTGSGCLLLAWNQSDGSPAWTINIQNTTPNANNEEGPLLYADNDNNAFTVCNGRIVLSLPVDGSITGSYSIGGGSVTITSLSNYTFSNVTTEWGDDYPTGYYDTTNAVSSYSMSSVAIDDPTFQEL